MEVNAIIESIFSGSITVGSEIVPVEYMDYEGHGESYVVYRQYDKDNSYSTEDNIAGYATYYDFDVYSRGDYLAIIREIKKKLRENFWTWQPSRDSQDMYDPDTKYFHKTVSFALPVQEVDEDPEEVEEVENENTEEGG
ncbi:MAG: hypothetical protein J6U23_05575 [Clostridiales bacterium]|nr:hypothetical protein [Clostridiales bacterium]